MRFRAIDSFRGLAAVMVILFHMRHLTILSDNALITRSDIFVDFFFVLSGFVITHSNFAKIADLASVKRFVVRRFRRLYPLHLFTLLLFLLFEIFRWFLVRSGVHLSNPVFGGKTTVESFFANLALVQSLHLFDLVTWNGPSWSISAEFYTYIAWALCLVLFRKNLLVFCSLSFGLFAWFIVRHHGNIIYTYDYGFVRCAYGFLIGMVAYRLAHWKNWSLGYPLSSLTEWLLIGLTLYSVYSSTHAQTWLMPFLFALVVIVFSRESGALSKLLATDRFEFLGKLSYSYYLNHVFVLDVIALVLFKLLRLPESPGNEIVYLLSCLLCIHLMSLFTYRHVELILQPAPAHLFQHLLRTSLSINTFMNILKAPKWVYQFNYPYSSFRDIPDSVFDDINRDLKVVQHDNPLVSIVIPAWNEEVNVLRSIASLAKLKTDIPFEILVVNNNSTDETQKTLDKLQIRSVFQPLQGWGPARQMGLEQARGTYILTADADSLYPSAWLNEMMAVLRQPGVVCVYGRYSFIPSPGFSRWKLFLLETLKDIMAELRHLKRPHLNAYGMSFGYIREYGLKAGYVMHKIRGEDGRLCFDLMQYGAIRQVKAGDARVWTGTRTLEKDGSFSRTLFLKIGIELRRFGGLFVAQQPHDTKTSTNN